MAEATRVQLRLNPAGRGDVFLDEVPVRNCRGVTVHTSLGQATTVTLELIGVEVELDAENVGEVWADVTNAGSANKVYAEVAG